MLSHNDEAGCNPLARNMPPNPIILVPPQATLLHSLASWNPQATRAAAAAAVTAGYSEPEPGSG